MTNAVNIAQGGSNNVTMRNRIINGNMAIDQRNAGAVQTSPSSNTYSLDRWLCNVGGGGFNIQQTPSATETGYATRVAAGFTNYLAITSTSVSAASNYNLRQFIEGFNTADLAFGTSSAKSITLSFWVYSSLTGTFGGSIQNSAGNRSYVYSYTIASANTWQQVTVTIPGDTSGTWVGATNGVGICLYIAYSTAAGQAGTAGSWSSNDYRTVTGQTNVVGTNGATFYITGVQLEAGTTASPFEYRQYGTELALCQRYFYKVFDANVDFQAVGTRDSATNAWINIATPVSMRTNPTLGVPSGYGRIILYDTSFTLAIPAISAMGITSAGTSQFHIYFGIASSAGSYVFTSYDTSGATTSLTLSAEL